MSMDINSLRTIVEVLVFVAFLGIVAWAWTRKDRFHEAANLPFSDEPGERPRG